MPGVIKKIIPWIKQPPYPVEIDDSNPLMRGLVFAFNGASYFDPVGHVLPNNVGGVVPRLSSAGFGPNISGSQYLEYQDSGGYNTIGECSIVWGGWLDATLGGNRCMVSKALGNGATNTPYDLYCDSASGKVHFVRSGSGYRTYRLNTTAPVAGQYTVCGVAASSMVDGVPEAWINNVSQSVLDVGGAGTGVVQGNTTPIRIGRRSDGATQLLGSVNFLYIFNRKISAGEYFQLYANPWQGFKPHSRRLYVSAGGNTALSGDAASASVSSGSLSTSIPLAGVALTVSAGSAQITTAVPLAGDAASISLASGDVVAVIRLSGTALADAVASGILSAGIDLSGTASVLASAQGSLSGQIQLSGDALSDASASASLSAGGGLSGAALALASAQGSLSVQIQLSGAALSDALAAGALSAGSGLSGAALGVASAAGDLVTQIPLAGASLAVSSASGNITTLVQLSGASASVTSVIGSLDVLINMAGAAVAEAFSGGDLTAYIRLDAAAVVQAAASGILSAASSAPTPGYRTFKVAAERRTLRVLAP